MSEESDILAQILAELKAQKTMAGQSIADLEEDLGQAADAAEDLAKAEEEAARAAELFKTNMQNALRGVGSALGSFGGALTQTTGKLSDFGEGLDGLGDAALDVGKNFGAIGLAAGLMAKALTAAASAAMKVTDASLEAKDSLSKLGGVGVGTAKDILNMAHAAGVSSKNMGDLIKPMQSMSGAFGTLGTTVGDGQKAFMKMADVGDDVRASFGRLGFSVTDLIQSQADFVKLQAMSGRNIQSQYKDQKALQQASLKYSENLVELASLTGTDIESAKKAKEFAANQYAEVLRTRNEDAKIRGLEAKLANTSNESERKRLKEEIEQTRFRQESRKALIAQAKDTIGQKEAAALAQAVATGMLGPGAAGLLAKGVNVTQLKRDLEAAKTEEERKKVINRSLQGIVDSTTKQAAKFGDAISMASAETQEAAGLGLETLQTSGRFAGKNLEEVQKLTEKEIAAKKAAGTDPDADARESLRKTQRAVNSGLDQMLMTITPLNAAIIALTVAVGTAALAFKGLQGGGIGGRIAGAIGGGGGAAGGAAGGGIGGALGGIGTGAGKGLEGLLRGASAGLTSFANPMVVAGAAGMGAAITVIGAGLAGATWLMGKALPTLAEGFEAFTVIDGDALKKTGIGIGALGAGLAVFGAGGVASSFGAVASSVADGLGQFFGAKTPFEKIEEFSKLNINAAKVEENAKAFAAFGSAMASYGGGSALKGLGDMAAGIGDFIGGLIGTSSPVEKIEEFGKLSINEGNLEKNAKAFAAFGNAMKSYTGGANASAGDLFSVWAESKGVENPVEAMRKFAALDLGEGSEKRVESNAKAFVAFSNAMAAYKGGGGATTGDLVSSVAEGLGANTPLEQMKQFAALDLGEGADKRVETNAKAFVEFANAMTAYKGGASNTIGEAVSSQISSFFSVDPPTVQMQKFAQISIDEKGVKQVKLNADAFVAFSNAMASYKGGPSEGIADSLLGGIKKAFGGDSESVINKFVKFTKLDVDPNKAGKLATAFAQYAGAMATFTAPRAARAAAAAAGGAGAPAAGGAAAAAPTAAAGGAAAAQPPATPDTSSHATPSTGGPKAPPKLASIRSKSGKSASVNAEYRDRFQGMVDWLERQGYKIYSLGGYVDRDVRGQPGKKSVHAHGGALDINPGDNPMGSRLITDMPAGVGEAAKGMGLGWGGNWRSVKDAMHFSVAKHEGGTVQLSDGGIATGSTSGFPATLHGKEMVIPLNGDSLLEKLGTMSADAFKNESSDTASKMESLVQNIAEMNQRNTSEWVSKLNTVIEVLERQQKTQEKTLRAVRT